LGIFRADDNVTVLLTNLGNGRYRGALRCGTKIVDQIQYFAQTKMFSSTEESIDTYSYPATIPSVEEDWQDFRYRNWALAPADIPQSVNICMRVGSAGLNPIDPGINFMPKLQTFTRTSIPADLVTQSIQALFTVKSYTTLPPTETEGEKCSVKLLYEGVPISLPQLNRPSSAVSVSVLNISIYSDRR
jgi:hypothetical protein